MPKVSIIVPVYNAEKYISDCIESILQQTFQDFEIILVNDGSKDSSGVICDSYAGRDTRVRVIHQENRGVSAARNMALSVSRGEFVTFIDSDDEILPCFLSNFSYDSNIDFEIQGFTLNYISDKSKNIVISPACTQVASLYDVYAESEYQKISRGPCCKLMKNDIIRQNKIIFPLDISFGEDAIFVKRYLTHCKGNARTISAGDYLYNQYDNSQSLTHRVHAYEMMYKYSWMDYQLFLDIERQLGEMPSYVRYDFIRNRSLEFYLSVVNCASDRNMESNSIKEYIVKIKSEMFQYIKDFSALPPTYRMVRFCLLYLSDSASSFILSTLFRWK